MPQEIEAQTMRDQQTREPPQEAARKRLAAIVLAGMALSLDLQALFAEEKGSSLNGGLT